MVTTLRWYFGFRVRRVGGLVKPRSCDGCWEERWQLLSTTVSGRALRVGRRPAGPQLLMLVIVRSDSPQWHLRRERLRLASVGFIAGACFVDRMRYSEPMRRKRLFILFSAFMSFTFSRHAEWMRKLSNCNITVECAQTLIKSKWLKLILTGNLLKFIHILDEI